MKIHRNDPPREYQCGNGPIVTMKDCAHIELAADEQITLKTEDAGEYDVARKSWGFYATPSINGRLERFQLSTALVKNRNDQYFVMLVEVGHEDKFEKYVDEEGLIVCGWFTNETLPIVESSLQSESKIA